MANEVTLTTADDLTYTAMILEENIIPALYANNNVGQLLRYKSLAGMPSKAADFPKPPVLAAAAVAEAVDLTNTPFATSKATVTAGEVGIMITPTDLLNVSDITDVEFYGRQLGFAVAEKFATDVTALSSGFSQSISDTGQPLTETMVLQAITTLEAADVPGPYYAVIHPQQKEDLVGDIGTTITPAGAGGQPARAATNEFGAMPDGSLGSMYGVTWWTNSTVPTANSGADRSGMIVSPDRALGHVEKWPVRTELERDASLRATEIVVTTAYGVGEVDDTSGVSLISDA